jgi:hypothetical protein
MSFNPYMINGVVEKYHTSRHIGHYWSQMTRVSEYVELIRRIEQSAHHNTVLNNILFVDTLLHAVILDFMAFAGQHVGYYHETSTDRHVKVLRDFLIMDIESQIDPIFIRHGIKETFLLIARLIKPIKDTVKRTLSSHLTRKADSLLADVAPKVDKTRLTPVQEPLLKIIYNRSQSPNLDDDGYENNCMSDLETDQPGTPPISPPYTIDTPVYQSPVPQGGRRIIDYETFTRQCNEVSNAYNENKVNNDEMSVDENTECSSI